MHSPANDRLVFFALALPTPPLIRLRRAVERGHHSADYLPTTPDSQIRRFSRTIRHGCHGHPVRPYHFQKNTGMRT